jgi:hypothetical protein
MFLMKFNGVLLSMLDVAMQVALSLHSFPTGPSRQQKTVLGRTPQVRASCSRQPVRKEALEGEDRTDPERTWLAWALGPGWALSVAQGEDLGAVLGDGDRVLEMSRQGTVRGDHGPPVGEHAVLLSS